MGINRASPPSTGVPEPADMSGALEKVMPGFGGLSRGGTDLIGGMLRGELSPQARQNAMDAAATYGVTSGMPGSGLARNITPRSIGLQTEQLQQGGLQNLLSMLGAYSGAVVPTAGQQQQNQQYYAGLGERQYEFSNPSASELMQYFNKSMSPAGPRYAGDASYVGGVGGSVFNPRAMRDYANKINALGMGL